MHLLVLSAFRQNGKVDLVKRTMVSMHLLVLSAFRLEMEAETNTAILGLNAPFGAQCFPTQRRRVPERDRRSQCTFWCSVLSDRFQSAASNRTHRSQCTFWCSVLSDSEPKFLIPAFTPVSMHLLVLSAFRL